jgi:hypothetical protein
MTRETNTINNAGSDEVPYWTVNGFDVSERTFNRMPETLLGITGTRSVFAWHRGRVYWDTVQDVLRTLDRRLNELGYDGTMPTPPPKPEPPPELDPEPTPSPEPTPTAEPEPELTPAPEPTPPPEPEPEPTDNEETGQDGGSVLIPLIIGIGIVAIAIVLMRLLYSKK